MEVRVDSRSAHYRHPLRLGGQQWRNGKRRQLRKSKRRRSERRSSLLRNRSSASHVSRIASHGPAQVEGGSMIARDGPAQVSDRGRRRDGGGLKPRASRRRPRCVRKSVPKLASASWHWSLTPFFFVDGGSQLMARMPRKVKAKSARRRSRKTARRETSIALYYWPTPNG